MDDVRQKLIEVRSALDQAIAMIEPSPAVDPKTPRLLCWGAKVSKDFRESVFWIEAQLGLKADNLMACMGFETGVTFSPSVKNPASSATGLIQFMDATAKGLNTTTTALAAMTAVRQLGFVYQYFKAFGADLSSWDLADTYMAILLPSMIGKPLDTPMNWSEGAYKVNAGLDSDHNKVVTKREAAAKVKAIYDLGMKKENLA